MYISEFYREAFTQLLYTHQIILYHNSMKCYKHAKLSLSLYSVCTFHHPVILIERILEPRFLLRYCRQKLVHGASPRHPRCALLVGVTRGEIAQGNHQNSYLIQVALEDPFRVLKLFPMWFTYARIVPRNFSLIIRKYNRFFNHFSLISGTSRNPGQVDDLTQLGWMAQASRAMVP